MSDLRRALAELDEKAGEALEAIKVFDGLDAASDDELELMEVLDDVQRLISEVQEAKGWLR